MREEHHPETNEVLYSGRPSFSIATGFGLSIAILSRIIHDNGFSSEEIEAQRRLIRQNILDAMKILLFVIPILSVDEIDDMTDFKYV
jgi:hypothetical protein